MGSTSKQKNKCGKPNSHRITTKPHRQRPVKKSLLTLEPCAWGEDGDRSAFLYLGMLPAFRSVVKCFFKLFSSRPKGGLPSPPGRALPPLNLRRVLHTFHRVLHTKSPVLSQFPIFFVHFRRVFDVIARPVLFCHAALFHIFGDKCVQIVLTQRDITGGVGVQIPSAPLSGQVLVIPLTAHHRAVVSAVLQLR